MERKFFGCYRSQPDPNELKWSDIYKDKYDDSIYISKKKNVIHKIIHKLFK
jgi:hypothetical protein